MLGADLSILFTGSNYPVLFLILLRCLSPLLPRVGLSKSLFLAKPISHPFRNQLTIIIWIPFINQTGEYRGFWKYHYNRRLLRCVKGIQMAD